MSNAAYQPGQSHVYAIAGVGTGLVKIGRATDPDQRLRELQIGSPVLLRLIATCPETTDHSESHLHRELADARRRGEWFELTEREAMAAVTGATALCQTCGHSRLQTVLTLAEKQAQTEPRDMEVRSGKGQWQMIQKAAA